MKSIWSDLPRRLLTVCIGFPLVWMILSNPTFALIFFIGAHGLVCWEYTALEPSSAAASSQNDKKDSNENNNQSITNRFGFIIVSLLLAHVVEDKLFHLLLVCCTGIFVWLYKHHWVLGLLVITIPFRTWYITSQDFSSTISILLVVWNCDTGALVFGRLSKKLYKNGTSPIPVPKWIHRISPAKSIEGFIGGFVGGTWTAMSWIPALMKWFNVDTTQPFTDLWLVDWQNRFLLGVSLSFLAITGDLVESSIKRQSQSKDSGSILPGHGGILDRFDSSLLSVLLYSVIISFF